MSKYAGLGDFLRRQSHELIPMRFAEIEKVTGVKLPPKAQHHRAWWSNNPGNNVMTKVWLAAGFRTEQVDMAHERLVFRRQSSGRQLREDAPAFAPAPTGRFAAIHPMFGALKGTFTIEPGWDTTKSSLEAADLDIDKTADLIDAGLRRTP